MELITIVEGIEDKQQAKLLTEMGCEIGQGYYFNHPLTADDFSTQYG